MNPRAVDLGPDEPQTMTCQGCNGTGQAYMGRFSPRPSTCRECLGEGEAVVGPDDWDDPRDPDPDPTLLWDDVDMDYGRGWAE